MRYEDILDHPQESFAEMLDFLGLPWDHGFQTGFERHEISAARADSFRTELAPAQLQAVEQVLGKTLAQWGYDATS